MTADTDPAEPIVGFQRHPASIELHLEPSLPYAAGHPFAGITTWHPTGLGDHETWEAAEAPALPPPIEPLRFMTELAEPGPLPIEPPPVPQVLEPSQVPLPEAALQEAPHPPLPQAPPVPVFFAPEPAPAEPLHTHAFVPLPTSELEPGRADLLWPGMPPHAYPVEPPRLGQLWDVEPVEPETRAPSRARAVLRPLAIVAAGIAAVCLLVFVGLRLVPAWLGSGRVEAVFNAPMMVVRAAVTGRVATIAATAGEMVEPQSQLLTIHTDDAANPDRRVLAGVHGLIRSVETVPGADLSTGSPLVRLHDCDRAFLTVAPDAKLAAGESVQVKMPNLPAVAGIVRRSSGIMEPPDSLVVGLRPGALANACPVGTTGSITPSPTG